MRRAPTNAIKVAVFPNGIRLDRLTAMLAGLSDTEARTGQLTLHTTSDGSVAVYKHQWDQR